MSGVKGLVETGPRRERSFHVQANQQQAKYSTSLSTLRMVLRKGMVTGVVLVDLSAAYDTVNHRCLLSKILAITRDTSLTELIESMLENRMFYVELGGKRSRWRRLKNGLPQGSVLAPLLQHLH